MVFFQAMLFAGYLHAHYTAVWVGPRRQALIHLTLAGGTLLALPFVVDAAYLSAPNTESPVLWLMQALVISVGAPVFLISATSPLLQRWFARLNHPAAHDPYFLYAASNAGSLIALLAYPTVVEPFSSLGQQWIWWSAGFALFVILLVLCAKLVHQQQQGAERMVPSANCGASSGVKTKDRVRWLLLSFAPASLLLGVTTYITTDVAAVPLFWVVPLALYLLTFISAFARRPLISSDSVARSQAFAITLLAVIALLPKALASIPSASVLLHIAVFFLTALMCHGELVKARPHATRLTEFYLWMSLGGLLGGAFNAFLAPLIFSDLFEYPLLLALACGLRPFTDGEGTAKQRRLDIVLAAALALSAWAALRGLPLLAKVPVALGVILLLLGMVGFAIVLLRFSARPWRFALAIGGVLGAAAIHHGGAVGETTVFQERSFFGVARVVHDADKQLNVLIHGSTVHGAQSLDPAKRLEMLTYYHRAGPYGQLFEAAASRVRDRPVAVIGLGAGTLACYGTQGSAWTFYEIDPLIERVARDNRLFTYLRDCPPLSNVVIGDARVTLRDAPDHGYALIVIDAFTSDAIPIHLLTQEAISAYRRKLAPDGLLALHITNRHLTLAPIIGNLASNAGLIGRMSKTPSQGSSLLASPAQLVVLASDASDLGRLMTDPNWLPLPVDTSQRVWSDDYVNMVRALLGS